jgi:hypothetical protein
MASLAFYGAPAVALRERSGLAPVVSVPRRLTYSLTFEEFNEENMRLFLFGSDQGKGDDRNEELEVLTVREVRVLPDYRPGDIIA